jgi:hypothetical protein
VLALFKRFTFHRTLARAGREDANSDALPVTAGEVIKS